MTTPRHALPAIHPADVTPATSGRPRKLSKRARRGVDLILAGACKTITEAAEKCGLSRETLSRAIHTPHGQAYMQDRTAREVAQTQMRAAAVVTDLLDSPSEHVRKDTAFGLLAINGYRTTSPVQNLTQVNISPGYVIDLSEPRPANPNGVDRRIDVIPLNKS